MKVIEADPSSAEDRIPEAPPSRMRAWRSAVVRRRTAANTQSNPARTRDDDDAPAGWWLVPAVIGGLMFWVWLIRLVIGWAATLF